MHRALLGLAAMAAFATMTSAQGHSAMAAGFSAPPASESSGTHHRGLTGRFVGNFRNDFRDCRGEHCRHIRIGDGFGYSGYNDYGDYDANRSFDPDKWNDWWNDRPDRAFPRWMARNQDCARQWYSADTLRC
jgi:hypothetical protein